jgi:hypothetical protein
VGVEVESGAPFHKSDGWFGGCDRRRQRLAEGQPHRPDLLLLRDDDLLRDPPQLLIVPVAQLGLRHLNRSSVMRDHHRGEILIYVPRRLDSMPVIIRVIAPTFSERNRDSWGGAERNAAEQIAVMYSAKEGASAEFAAANAVAVAMRPAVIAHKLRRIRERGW